MATTLLEFGAGLCMVGLPTLALWLLLGVREPSPEALVVGRIGGVGLVAIGVACWLARDDRRSRSQHGLLGGILIYNVGTCAVLAFAGLMLRMDDVALWPVVVLHAVMTIWCAQIYGRRLTWDEQQARAVGLPAQSLRIRGPSPDLNGAFEAARRDLAQAIVVLDAGGLIAYGTSRAETGRRVAAYVDRIFQGAQAGPLPVERLTRHELINLQTARSIGVTLPPGLLKRADRVIQ